MSHRNSKKSNRLAQSLQNNRGIPNHFAHQVSAQPPTSPLRSPSEISNFKSAVSSSAPSSSVPSSSSSPSQISNFKLASASPSAVPSIQLDPLPQERSPSELSTQNSSLPSASPIDNGLSTFQSQLNDLFKKHSPESPHMRPILDNYATILQIATVERLIASLPGLSESAMVETNAQIVRMLSIIERTNARIARELREKDAAARRITREHQRQERQAQKEVEAAARTQRQLQLETQRRQREQEKSHRAEKKLQPAVPPLDLVTCHTPLNYSYALHQVNAQTDIFTYFSTLRRRVNCAQWKGRE